MNASSASSTVCPKCHKEIEPIGSRYWLDGVAHHFECLRGSAATAPQMSLSELREMLEHGDAMDGVTWLEYIAFAKEYARRTADCVSVGELEAMKRPVDTNVEGYMDDVYRNGTINEIISSIQGAKP